MRLERGSRSFPHPRLEGPYTARGIRHDLLIRESWNENWFLDGMGVVRYLAKLDSLELIAPLLEDLPGAYNPILANRTGHKGVDVNQSHAG